MRYLTLTSVLLFLALPAQTQTMAEQSSEARFQIDLKVPDAALKAYIPDGWTPNVATQGPAKDCNLRLVFIDRVTINTPDGKPKGAGSNRLAFLVAPVKDASGASVQLVIGGITEDPADDPFGVYLPASLHQMRRTTYASASGPVLDSQDWVLSAASGEHLEMHITYEKGVGAKGSSADTKFYSAKDPTVVQISRQEQVLDILKNVTTMPTDRVKDFTLKIS
ncbi:MAG TPA: hypothetical protein VNH18_27265, partial [Bryobacteraceae bacterium]|nr:hypothetical protein [Bryobacteraceae bacterium]